MQEENTHKIECHSQINTQHYSKKMMKLQKSQETLHPIPFPLKVWSHRNIWLQLHDYSCGLYM